MRVSNHLPLHLKKAVDSVRRQPVLTLVILFSGLGLFFGSLLLWNTLRPSLSPLGDLGNHKQLWRQWQDEFGPWMPAIFILVHAFQVVAAPIPGEMTGFLAGYLFGVYAGFFYSMAGLILGSCLDFCLGRWLGKFLLQKVIPREILENFGFLFKKEGKLIAFLLFLLPGFPKDFLCYFLGTTPMAFVAFLAVMAVGRTPATWILALQGAQVARGNYPLFLSLIGAATMVMIAFYAYRKRMYGWIRRRAWAAKSLVTLGAHERAPLLLQTRPEGLRGEGEKDFPPGVNRAGDTHQPGDGGGQVDSPDVCHRVLPANGRARGDENGPQVDLVGKVNQVREIPVAAEEGREGDPLPGGGGVELVRRAEDDHHVAASCRME
jgi:uncharacterized membrane protein YdjX (TVP38/TMEM64 family)